MSNTLYKLYKTKLFRLAESMVVKHSEAALAINYYLQANGYVIDWNAPATWKYYLNMAGQYHQFDMDRIRAATGSPYMMIKVASDTGPVDAAFTRYLVDPAAPYLGDVAIANEYRYGTEYYNDLVRRYPDFEELILGILYPVELSVSLDAQDGDILYAGGYFRSIVNDEFGKRVVFAPRADEGREDEGLIEANETNLLEKLETYIKGFLVRWHNTEYQKTHNLYIPSMLGILYSTIPLTVANIRMANCHTPQVHSYHVQEYLESHGKLAKYIPALPLRETLWLYRNVRYLEKNVGKRETFQLMVDNLLTPAGVPLSGYSLRHNLSDMPGETFDLLRQEYPEPFAMREVINFRQVGSGRDNITIEQLIEKEAPIAPGNSQDLDIVIPAIEEHVATMRGNRVPTKVIESAMLDFTDRIAFPFPHVLMNHWVFCASRGTYTGSIFVSHPLTGDRLHLTPLSAFILAYYCFIRYQTGVAPVHIPQGYVRMIPRSSTFTPDPSLDMAPTLAQLKQVVASSAIRETSGVFEHWSPDAVWPTSGGSTGLTALMGSQVPEYTFNTTDAFYRGTKKIHREMMRRWAVVNCEEDLHARAEMEFAMSQLYWLEVPVTLSTVPTYEEWFEQTGILVTDLEEGDYVSLYKQLADEIVQEATGNRDNEAMRLKQMQQALMAILRQFSSYSVQYVYSINDSPALLADIKPLRLSNLQSSKRSRIRARINTFSVMDIRRSVNAGTFRIDPTTTTEFALS